MTRKLERSREYAARPQQNIDQQREVTEESGQAGLIERAMNYENHRLGPRRHTVRKSRG